jgi:hypothetical protein
MDFSKYLSSLDEKQLPVLYDSPWTCQAVLRSLQPLAQQLVLRLLHIDHPVPDHLVTGIGKSEHRSSTREASETLQRLQVLKNVGKQSSPTWQLEPAFR